MSYDPRPESPSSLCSFNALIDSYRAASRWVGYIRLSVPLHLLKELYKVCGTDFHGLGIVVGSSSLWVQEKGQPKL